MERVRRPFYDHSVAGTLFAVAEPVRKATYDDVLAAPEHEVAEILDGELFLSPRPALPHASATTALAADLHGRFNGPPGEPERPGGWRVLFEPELRLGEDVVVPDLAGWRRERLPRLPPSASCDVAPDWVCETLSPSTAAIDRGRKLRIFARAGVSHCWLLDPFARTLETFELGGERLYVLTAVYSGDDRPRARPFEAIELELARLWLD